MDVVAVAIVVVLVGGARKIAGAAAMKKVSWSDADDEDLVVGDDERLSHVGEKSWPFLHGVACRGGTLLRSAEASGVVTVSRGEA